MRSAPDAQYVVPAEVGIQRHSFHTETQMMAVNTGIFDVVLGVALRAIMINVAAR